MKKNCLHIVFMFLTLCVHSQCWQSISGGDEVSAGIKTNGTLWAWGDPGTGALGTGNYNGLYVPTQIGTANNWQSVSIDGMHSAGIQNNGTLWLWGDNSQGELGNGTFLPDLIPTQLGTATDWKSVVAVDERTFAIKTNGTLWAWGDNNLGQLGDGTQIDKNIPTQIGTDADWKSISSRYAHTLAIKMNGTLWAWGGNAYLLGNGGSGLTASPTQVGTDTNWQEASASYWRHSAAIKTDGTLWAWGENYSGEVGDGTNTTRYLPVQIGTATDWKSVSTGFASTYAIKNNGSLWSWGFNAWGELGNGTNTDTNIPGQVGAVLTWQIISEGSAHSLALRTDGTLWAWGRNDFHQLGINDTLNRNVPVMVLSPSITVNSTSTSVCSGSPVTLNGSGANTYTWSGGVANGVSFTPVTSAVYTVTGTDAIGCYNTATVSITVNPYTTVTANATSTTICAGGTVALTGSGATNYAWSGTVVNGQSFSPVGTATYNVTDTTGCSNTASITVNVMPLPMVSVNSISMCAGSNAMLTASATPMAGTTYSWSTGSVGNSLSVSPTSNSVYTVTATNSGCDASAIASVSVIPVVTPVTGFSYNSPLCLTATNPLPMPISGFSASGTYFSGAGLTINPTTGFIDLSSSNAGTYVITYSVAVNGCNPSSNSTFTLTLDAPTVPITNFSYASPFCQKDVNPSPLLASNFVSGGTFNSGGLNINATNGTIDLASSTAGAYTISYQVNAANCVQAGTSTTTVVVNSNPTLSTSSSTVIITGEQTILTAISGANTYTWFPTTNLSCTNCANPTASPNVTTNYCVQTTDGVCTNSACINVIVEALCEGDKGLYLPNAFSPNGDGNNDVFCVQGETKCTTDFKMLIFDRWGEKVFESTVITFCWDGTYKSKALNPDVYIYYITAISKDQEKVTKKGNVTLIK